MKKRVLLIDNDDINEYFIDLQEKWGDKNPVDLETFWFNPVDREFEKEDRDIDFELMLSELEKRFLKDKIDVIGCDFNIHNTNKMLTFSIIERIRKFNKICTVFVYSGAPNKELLRHFEAAGDREGEKLLHNVITSGILAFKKRSNAIPEFLLLCLKNPTIEIIVEDELMNYATLEFGFGYSTLKGQNVSNMIEDIRLKTPRGINCVREVVSRGVQHALQINFH